MGDPTRARRPAGHGTATALMNGRTDRRDSTTGHLGIGGPEGPCQCADLRDRILLREPACDVRRRRELARRRVWRIERRWRELRDVRRYFEEVSA
jgi:hypothetical protein